MLPSAVGAVGCACVAALGVRAGVLAAAVACRLAGVALRRLPTAAGPVRPDAALALVLDLAAAALRAGRPLADALSAGGAGREPGTAALSTGWPGCSGSAPTRRQAWAAVPPDGPLSAVAAAAMRSAASGVRVAIAFERLAAELRADLAAAAAVRAQRAGVFAMAPLGLCFLPSFVCLGVVPVVVGVASTLSGGCHDRLDSLRPC